MNTDWNAELQALRLRYNAAYAQLCAKPSGGYTLKVLNQLLAIIKDGEIEPGGWRSDPKEIEYEYAYWKNAVEEIEELTRLC